VWCGVACGVWCGVAACGVWCGVAACGGVVACGVHGGGMKRQWWPLFYFFAMKQTDVARRTRRCREKEEEKGNEKGTRMLWKRTGKGNGKDMWKYENTEVWEWSRER